MYKYVYIGNKVNYLWKHFVNSEIFIIYSLLYPLKLLELEFDIYIDIFHEVNV